MIRQKLILIAALVALSSCQKTEPQSAAPAGASLASELVIKTGPTPPDGPEDACWGKDILPAIIETVTEQVIVEPAQVAVDGTILRPASYRSDTHQRIVQERSEAWFRVPCPEAMNTEFIATLQRALKARGLYRVALSGVMDADTISAVRRFQAPRGLDSGILSLAAARQLGVVAYDRDTL